jgi:copper transport protein
VRRVARVLLALGIASAVTLGFAGIAAAHANLASSDPAANASLDHAPAAVTMTFTEPPDPNLSIVHVLDVNGTDVEAGPVQAMPGQEDQLRSPLPTDLPDGVYTVSWRVVSEADGHFTTGAFSFGVNVAPGTVVAPSIPVPTTPPPSAASVASKLCLYVGLAMLFAASVVGLLAFSGNVPARRPVLLIGSAVAAVGAVGILLSERTALGVSMSDLLSSSTGRDFLWLLGGVTFAAVASIDAARRSDRTSLLVVGIAASLAMLIRAVGGHASAAPIPALEIGLQWFHFMAASVWMGGLLLAFLAVRASRDAESPVAEIRRYSSLAGYAVAVVLVTGVLRATEEVGGFSTLLHLFTASYLTTLDIKVAVVMLLIGLGAINRYRSIPRMGASTGLLRRLMAIELVGALGVFGLTGTLTGLSPRPPVTPAAPEPPQVTLAGSDFATTMKVTLVVSPGAAGPNGFDAEVTDFDSSAPLDATDVSLRFEPVGQPGVGVSTLKLAHHGDHWMATGSQVSIAGVWTITVVVQTASSGTEIPLTFVTQIPDQSVTVATAAGQPDIYTIAFPGGEQIQMYNDPGNAGTDELHLTAFDTDGTELPLAHASMVAVAPDGQASSLQSRRFSAGHFVGDLTLAAGDWTFFVRATARDGRVLVASFEQTI